MNLSEVRKLKDGDVVRFCEFPRLTPGKPYTVHGTSLGKYITTDTGLQIPLATSICLENYFREDTPDTGEEG